jgi:hypothetical protein
MRTPALSAALLTLVAAVGCGSTVVEDAPSGATTTSTTDTTSGAGGGATTTTTTNETTTSTTTTTDTTTHAGGAGGAGGGTGGSPEVPYPAPHPSMPQMPNHGGGALHDPLLVTVTWAGDDLQPKLETFGDTLGSLAWWDAVRAEYGVHAAKGGGHVVIQDEPAATLSDSDVRAWLAAKVADATLPAPTDQTIYMLYFPVSTTISLDPQQGGGTSCQDFGGYHDSTWVKDANGQQVEVAYAVLPRCGDIDSMTVTASHEVTEAATDPHPEMTPGYVITDPHSAWAALGGEDADLCETVGGTSEAGWMLTRAWSNTNAKAGDQPCVPVPQSDLPFFDAGIVKERLKLKPGESGTTEVQCYSFGPLPSDISLGAKSMKNMLTFSFDKPTCKNGDVVTLTVTLSKSATKGTDYHYRLNASLDPQTQHVWRGVVTAL